MQTICHILITGSVALALYSSLPSCVMPRCPCQVGPLVAVAGMIGLEAGSMRVVEGGAQAEGRLALRHLTRVLEAVTGSSQGQGRDMLMQVRSLTISSH